MKEKIVVLGAGKGIGKAIADLANKKGYSVIAISRSYEDLQNKPYETRFLNLINPETIYNLQEIAFNIGSVINCTGTHPGEQKFDFEWNKGVINIMHENLWPALHAYQAFLPTFRKKGKGYFIHASSVALNFYNENETGYCASKAALEAIVRTLQDMDKNNKIKHYAVRVPLTDTPLARRVCVGFDDWKKVYTVNEIASIFLNIIENSENYLESIIEIPPLPVRN